MRAHVTGAKCHPSPQVAEENQGQGMTWCQQRNDGNSGDQPALPMSEEQMECREFTQQGQVDILLPSY